MILLGSQYTHRLQLGLIHLMKNSFLLSVSSDSGKDESDGAVRRIRRVREEFKAKFMDFSHRLYGCVNMRIVLVEQNFFSQHSWTFLLDFFKQTV